MENLVSSLGRSPWPGPEAIAEPLTWDFHFTTPMLNILKAGSSAQKPLLKALLANRSQEHRKQVVILLGGVGDERAIPHLLHAMAQDDDQASMILVYDLALTNITAADVIWPHGGGIVLATPHADSRRRWERWWQENRATFKANDPKIDRQYANHPGYGIYKQDS